MKPLYTLSIIGAIIKKNIRRLTRSKVSALMIILGPLIIMLLAGIAFDQAKLYGIKIGAHLEINNNVTQTVLKSLEARNFKVTTYTSQQSCIDSVKSGQSHVCILFMTKNDKTHLEFHVDYSKLNLVYTLVNTLSSGLQAQSQKISMGLAEDLFETIGKTAEVINSKSKSLDTMYKNVESLSARITKINGLIDAVNTTLPSLGNTSQTSAELKQSSKEISELESKLNAGLNKYIVQLAALEATVAEVSVDLEDLDADSRMLKENISDVYNKLGCTVKDNIFSQLNSNIIVDKIQQNSEPTCAIVYSVLQELTDRTESISKASSQVTQLKRDIITAKSDLQNTKDGVADASKTAQQRINMMSAGLTQVQNSMSIAQQKSSELSTMKFNLKSELSLMQVSMRQGLIDISAFKQSLDGALDTVNQLADQDADRLIKPIQASVKPITSNKKILDYLFPSLLVFVLTFTGILLSATLVMKERGSAAYFRNFITPVPTILFVIGTYATALIILLIQLVVLFILGSFAFQVSVFSNLGPTSVILLLTCSVFISIGMLIGYTFRSEETTTLAAICVSSVLLLFSSLIVPIENVKSTLASVLQFSPFVLADSALRISLIFDQSIVAIWPQVLGLLIYATLLFLGSYYILRRSLRKM